MAILAEKWSKANILLTYLHKWYNIIDEFYTRVFMVKEYNKTIFERTSA